MPEKNSRKEKNFIAAYFSPFGLKQICDITMTLGGIMLIIGLIASVATPIVVLVGVIIMGIGSALTLVRVILVLTSDVNHASRAFKNAVINCIIMGVIFLLCLFLIIYIPVALL